MICIGIIEIILSQIPNFHKLSVLSIIAAFMAFGYASIGVGLSLATVIQGYLLSPFFLFSLFLFVLRNDK
jgi:hypothetical protein